MRVRGRACKCVYERVCVCMYGDTYLLDGCEFESRIELLQLLVAGSLLVLPVTLGGVEHYLAFEVHRL